jgi:hypothetical protein
MDTSLTGDGAEHEMGLMSQSLINECHEIHCIISVSKHVTLPFTLLASLIFLLLAMRVQRIKKRDAKLCKISPIAHNSKKLNEADRGAALVDYMLRLLKIQHNKFFKEN